MKKYIFCLLFLCLSDSEYLYSESLEDIEKINLHYQEHILPILKKKCGYCHIESQTKWVDDLWFFKDRYNGEVESALADYEIYDSFESQRELKDQLPVIESQLTNNAMPPLSSKYIKLFSSSLSKEEKSLIIEWIKKTLPNIK